MNEKQIKNAIDGIEPEIGAKERMYQNIMKKAQQQAAPASKPAVRKSFMRYALPIAACFCLLVIGITRFLPGSTPTTPGGNGVQIANPFVEVQSTEDFKAIGITLDTPAGARNVMYTIIDNEIADVGFEMDGKSFTVRASAQSGDFSGLFGSEEIIETIDASQNAVLSAVRIDASQYYKITWTNGKVNYCLYGTDGADGEQVQAVYEAMKK